MSAEKDRTKIAAPDDARRDIQGLVQRFARNLDVYTRPDHKETQVRAEHTPDLREDLHTATIPADKKLYQRQIEATNHDIDALL